VGEREGERGVKIGEVVGPRERERERESGAEAEQDEPDQEIILRLDPTQTTYEITLDNVKVHPVSASPLSPSASLSPSPSLSLSLSLTQTSLLTLGPLSLSLIIRSGLYGLRAKNPNAKRRRTFRGLAFYPPSPSLSLSACLRLLPPPLSSLLIPTAIEGVRERMSIAAEMTVIFASKLKMKFSLLGERGEREWLLIFRDATSGVDSYGGGRYLYIPNPFAEQIAKEESQGKVVEKSMKSDGKVDEKSMNSDGKVDENSMEISIDFNRCFVPPCAFIPFATCARAPPGNVVPIRVEAGEKGEREE
jgi:uncharacterized protein (DUF1684 family)